MSEYIIHYEQEGEVNYFPKEKESQNTFYVVFSAPFKGIKIFYVSNSLKKSQGQYLLINKKMKWWNRLFSPLAIYPVDHFYEVFKQRILINGDPTYKPITYGLLSEFDTNLLDSQACRR